jgi:hypothetical protein
MKKAIAVIASIAQLAFLSANDFDKLLERAVANDRAIALLSLKSAKAEIAFERAALSRSSPSFSLDTGEASATLGGSGASFGAAPSAGITLPKGASFQLAVPIEASSDGAGATPRLDAKLPLVRGRDEKFLAEEAARDLLAAAREERIRAELELEKILAKALKAVLAAESSLQAAIRAEAKQAREFERARTIDGAEPGGTAYMGLQRKEREAARARRDAEAAKAQAMAELRALVGPGGEAELLPATYPEPDMSRPLSAPESSRAAAASRAARRAEARGAAEADKRNSLSATLGAGYGLGRSTPSTVADSGDRGLTMSGGLAAAVGASGLELSCGLAWNAHSGPSATVSLAWSPPPRGDEALRGEDASLAARLREEAYETALGEARRTALALEEERRGLFSAAADAEEDLAFAEAMLAAYSGRRDDGLVSEAEYAEALADRDECLARSRMAILDRITWDIEARLLVAGAEAYGEDQ